MPLTVRVRGSCMIRSPRFLVDDRLKARDFLYQERAERCLNGLQVSLGFALPGFVFLGLSEAHRQGEVLLERLVDERRDAAAKIVAIPLKRILVGRHILVEGTLPQSRLQRGIDVLK